MNSLIDKDPTKRTLRHFAWVVALSLAVLARYRAPEEQVWLALAAAAVFSLGTVLPGLFRWPLRIALSGFYPFVWLATIAFLLILNLNLKKRLGACSRLAARLVAYRHRRPTTTVPSS